MRHCMQAFGAMKTVLHTVLEKSWHILLPTLICILTPQIWQHINIVLKAEAPKIHFYVIFLTDSSTNIVTPAETTR